MVAKTDTVSSLRAVIRRMQADLAIVLEQLDALHAPVANGQALPEAIPLGPRIAAPRAVGYRWMEALMGFNIQPPLSFPDEYEWIGKQTEADLAKVAAALQADEWVATHRGLVTPRHLVRNWGRYLNPPPKYEPKLSRLEEEEKNRRSRLLAFDQETAILLEMPTSAQFSRGDFLEKRAELRMLVERKL
jgi:hypothetical protein